MNFATLYNIYSQLSSTGMILVQRVTGDPRFNTVLELGRFADDIANIAVVLLT